jgi:hypothetical protein
MEFSNQQNQNSHLDKQDNAGEALVETVISLTGLPEPLVSQELDQILELSGHQSSSLTLDQLREAMLLYLECIQKSVESQA